MEGSGGIAGKAEEVSKVAGERVRGECEADQWIRGAHSMGYSN